MEAAAAPEHHRRDHVARAGGVVVEQPEDGAVAQRHAQLLVQLAPGSVDGVFALVEPTAGQRPLRRVRVEPGRPAAQHERGVAGHVGHPAVEGAGTFRNDRHLLGGGRRRVDPVLTLGGVDHHDGHGGAPSLVERNRPSLVAGEVGDDPRPQSVVIGEGVGRHGPIVPCRPGGASVRTATPTPDRPPGDACIRVLPAPGPQLVLSSPEPGSARMAAMQVHLVDGTYELFPVSPGVHGSSP